MSNSTPKGTSRQESANAEGGSNPFQQMSPSALTARIHEKLLAVGISTPKFMMSQESSSILQNEESTTSLQ